MEGKGWVVVFSVRLKEGKVYKVREKTVIRSQDNEIETNE